MLDKEVKQKMLEAREKYFTYLGSRDVEYEVVIFKELKHWEEGCKEEPDLYSQERTSFYARVVRKIEKVIGQEGMGDIRVHHNGNTLFIIFQEQGYHWWPKNSKTSDFRDEWEENKKKEMEEKEEPYRQER